MGVKSGERGSAAAGGAPEREAEGRRPSEPGMTLDSSDKLRCHIVSVERNGQRESLHIAEQVLSEENTIKLPRARNDEHAGGVHKLVVEGNCWELLLQRLRYDLAPKPARS